MKPVVLFALSFLPLFAFLTNVQVALSSEPVLDVREKPILAGARYYIVPARSDLPGSGLILAKTGKSDCPATVLQHYKKDTDGLRVTFYKPESTFEFRTIFTGLEVEIEFADSPWCVETSKWSVFVDNEIKKACVGIGGAKAHPGQQTYNGKFYIDKHGFGYKLVFCITGSPTCLNIGTFDAKNGEEGRRLNLTEHEPFQIVFVPADEDFVGIIKSVV